MTPAARYGAAITVLDAISDGQAAEPALAAWARGNRYAGSKDRAAVRDHVFDVLRMWRSCAAWGGNDTGRGLVLGLLRQQGVDVADIFGAGGYAPAALNDGEMPDAPDLDASAAVDIPAWLWPAWEAALGESATATAQIMRQRAGLFLRVNLRRGSVAQAADILAAEGIETQPHPDVATCLEVTANPRRVALSPAYLEGLVEVQDSTSQAAMAALGPVSGRVLDYCAGGGGKALALADMYDVAVIAHDVAPQRMVDLPARAARAGVAIAQLDTAELRGTTYDMVLCDAPCTGSGTWRRTPEAKWNLTPDRLAALQAIQHEVLVAGAQYVATGGRLIYATCSVLSGENDLRVKGFCAENPEWTVASRRHWRPSRSQDGFFLAELTKS